IPDARRRSRSPAATVRGRQRACDHGTEVVIPAPRTGEREASRPSEAIDRLVVLLATFRVRDTEALLGSQAQDADLALVVVGVHVVGGLTGLVQRVDLRH